MGDQLDRINKLPAPTVGFGYGYRASELPALFSDAERAAFLAWIKERDRPYVVQDGEKVYKESDVISFLWLSRG